MIKFKTIVALILTLTITMMIPLQTLAANNGKYVSEVYVAYGKDAGEAKKTLENKGFTPVEGNLNDNDDTCVMMGYKTTDNIRDSVTDLAVMNMNGAYSVEDYKTFLKKQKTEIAEFLEEFMAVIREYRANLKAGKAKATYVHDLLNTYVDDDTGMKMGDLLNSETLQDRVGVNKSIEAANPESLPNLVTILMQGNVQVIKSMEVLLSMATDTAENSWIDRFAELDYDTLLDRVEDERPDLNTETKRVQYLENLYGEEAALIGSSMLTLRDRLIDYETAGLYIETITEDDIKNTFGDLENDADAMLNYEEWLSIASVYDGLKNFEGGNFEKGELLDFFLEANDPEDAEVFIPMAAALSAGQRYGLPFVNFEQLLKFAFTSDKGWKKFVDSINATFEGEESVSVFQNIDRDIYKDDGSVALTGAAQRANNTADGTTGTEAQKMDTEAKITVISWVATLGCAAAWGIVRGYSKMVLRNFVITDFTTRSGKVMLNAYLGRVIRNDKAFERFVKFNTRRGDLTIIAQASHIRYSIWLTGFLKTATIFLMVASALITVNDLTTDRSVEQLPIPKYMVDNYTDPDGGSYSLNYKAVECNREEFFGEGYKKQKGSSADLNADTGKQWLALYASKNSKAGRPITPDFIVQDSNEAPSGYEGCVHLFGEKGAVNVVGNAFKLYSTASLTWQAFAGEYKLYVFSKLSNDVKTYDESTGNMTASTIENGTVAIIGFGSLIVGAALGAVVTVLIGKKKKAARA